MFDFLKKKLQDFVGGIVKKEQAKPVEPIAAKPLQPVPAKHVEPAVAQPPQPIPVEPELPKTVQPTREPEPATPAPEPAAESPAPEKIIQDAVVREEKREQREQAHRQENRLEKEVEALEASKPIPPEPLPPLKADSLELEPEEEEIEELVGGTEEGRIKKERKVIERRIVDEKKKEDVARSVFTQKKEEAFLADEKERDLKPKVGFFTQLKGVFTGGITITDAEVTPLFKDLEVALLESDVSWDTAEALVKDLRARLVGKRVAAGQVGPEVKKEIAFVIASMMRAPPQTLPDRIRAAKDAGQAPFVVLFLGPNGAGKTTTIAKVAHALKGEGLTCVISASDTFRAAAIEQAEIHGEKLGVKVVKHKYGADPAAVAFDAIAHAKAHNLDAVLVDTAGRQETNRNLVAEMEKIVRITKPHLKIFVAEAIAGTSLISQLKAFHEKLQVDGIVLTKLDCDAKGGGSLSIAYECKLPVYYVGVGQGYDDLKPFNESWIVRNILAE